MITAVLTAPAGPLTPGSVAAASLSSLALCLLATALLQRTAQAAWQGLYLLALAAWAIALDHPEPGVRMLTGPWLILALAELLRGTHALTADRSRLARAGAAVLAASLTGVLLCLGEGLEQSLALANALLALLTALQQPGPGGGVRSLAWWALVPAWLAPSEQGWLWPLILLGHGGLVALAAGLELRGLATSQNHHQSGPALDSAEALRGLRLDLAALRLLASLPGDRHRPGILRQIARGSTALEQQVSRLEDEVRQGPDSLRPAREEFDLFALLRRSLEPLRGGGAAPLLYASVDPRLPRRWRGDARRLEELLGELVGRCLAQPFAATVALAVGDGGVLAGHPALLWRLEIDTLAGARILTPELRRRIDRLGGQCGLRGSGGRGIWLRLPLQPAPIQPLESAPAVPWRQRVLLVHAHRGYRQALARILRHQNCLVDEAPDGATALALLTASRAGHHRYEWLLIQPADGPAEARALQLEILQRWPRSALNLVVLSSSEGGIHPPRPLLCNDVPALLATHVTPASRPLPLGRQVLIMGGRERLRRALSTVLTELGCRVARESGWRLAERLELAPCRHGFAPDVLLLVEAPELTAELTRLVHRRPTRPLPELITLGGEGEQRESWRALGVRTTLPLAPHPDDLARALAWPQPPRPANQQLPPAPWRDSSLSGEPTFPTGVPAHWHTLLPG